MALSKRYLTDDEIDDMAHAAFASYEWTASWRRAGEAAREHAADEYGVDASSTAVGLAVRHAQVMWEAARMAAGVDR